MWKKTKIEGKQPRVQHYQSNPTVERDMKEGWNPRLQLAEPTPAATILMSIAPLPEEQ